uniref:Ion_trans_2 domain-containing protein n=1 Tax=Panagrellus redivivus TaxID=6233 RepID=A0A7E4V0X9_PANRE
MEQHTFPDMILFCFTTLATIGYGNISPTTKPARLFCIAYATLGIPLCVLMLGNLGKHLAKAYWMVKVCLGRVVHRPCGEANLPLKIILLLYFIVFMFGCLLYPPEQASKDFTLQNLYFSVISFSTVGFGDESPPLGSSWWHFLTMYVYLSCGMILSTMLFSDLYSKLRRVDKIGTRVRGAQDVVVWFGNKPMKVSQLLQMVAKEFEVKPGQMHSLLHGLDDLLQEAAIEIERKSSTDTDSNASATTIEGA